MISSFQVDSAWQRSSAYIWFRGEKDRQSNGERVSYFCRIRTRTTSHGNCQFRYQSNDGTITKSTTQALGMTRMVTIKLVLQISGYTPNPNGQCASQIKTNLLFCAKNLILFNAFFLNGANYVYRFNMQCFILCTLAFLFEEPQHRAHVDFEAILHKLKKWCCEQTHVTRGLFSCHFFSLHLL